MSGIGKKGILEKGHFCKYYRDNRNNGNELNKCIKRTKMPKMTTSLLSHSQWANDECSSREDRRKDWF